MSAISDEWVRHDVGRVFVRLFDNALAAWLGERPALCVMQLTCGRGLVVEQNGDVYSCDHYVDAEHRLGNLLQQPLEKLVVSKAQRRFGQQKAQLPDNCHRCPWRFACQGGCPKHRVTMSLYTILCKCLFSEVTVEAVTELDDKTAHCHAPVPQRHRPFL